MSQELIDKLEQMISLESNLGKEHKADSELPMKLFKIIRSIEIIVCVVVAYLYFTGGVAQGVLVFLICWLLINPANFLYSVVMENANNANIHFVNADILKTKSEVLHELKQYQKIQGL